MNGDFAEIKQNLNTCSYISKERYSNYGHRSIGKLQRSIAQLHFCKQALNMIIVAIPKTMQAK